MPAPMAEAVWTQATQQLVLGVKLVKGAEAQVLLGGDEPVKVPHRQGPKVCVRKTDWSPVQNGSPTLRGTCVVQETDGALG